MTNNTNLETAGKEKRKIDTDLKKFHGEAATSAIEDAGIAYQSPSLIAAGAGAQGISLMSFFTNLVLALLFSKAPGVAEKLGSTKKSVLVLSLSSVITWLPLIVVFILFRSVNTPWIVALWVFSLIPSTMLIPLRDSWMAGKVPARNVGRYFGRRSLIAGMAYLGTFSLMGYILDHFFGQVFQGYAIILGIAFIASMGSFFLYRKIDAPPEATKEKVEFGFRDFVKEMRGGNLGVFILFISLFSLSVSLASPLCAVYLLKNLKFTYLTYTLLVSVEYVARIVSVTFWGKYADRVGSLKVLGVVSRLIPFIPILWLFSSNLAYLVFVFIVSGIVWAGFDLCSQTFIYKASPENKRMKYIGYYKSLVTLAMALGALCGAGLLNVVPAVFGSGILGMFLLSGISRLLVVRLMFRKLVDLAWSAPAARSKAMYQPAAGNVAVQNGLFYRPEEWTLYLQETISDEAEVAKPIASKGMFHQLHEWADYLYKTIYLHEMMPREAAVTPAKGLFHKPEAWSDYLQEVAPAEPEVKAASSRQGLFHQPVAWSDYWPEAAPVGPEPEAVSLKGIFHKPEAWSDYLQETAPADAEAMAVPSRQGLFHQPEAWVNYLQNTAPVEPEPEIAAAPSRSGLFHRPEAWLNYLQETSLVEAAPEVAAKPSSGLFRNPEAWSSYLQSTAPVEAKAKPETGRVAQSKRRFLPVSA